MEIPVINRLSDNLENGISSFQNPSSVSPALAFSGVEKVFQHQASNLWKWGALILALLASFTTIIHRIKLLLVQFRNHPLISSRRSHPNKEENYDYDTDTDASSSCSPSSSDDEDEEEEEEEEEHEEEASASELSSSRSWRSVVDQDFGIEGSHKWQSRNSGLFRRRRNSSIGDLFSWSEFTSGKNVVKLWDNLGLGLAANFGASDDSRNVAVYDMNKEKTLFWTFSARLNAAPAAVSASSSSSPAVIVSAEESTNAPGKKLLRVWDTRVGCRIPALLAEWSPRLGKIVGVNAGGVEKVYVRDDVSGGGLTVGDMRKVSSPLADVTESDVDSWWDADAVILADESR